MSSIQIVCPKIFPDLVWNEAEVLGAMTWLWYQDNKRHKVALDTVIGYLLPPIKLSQFVVFYEEGKPIGFVSWASLNEHAEYEYLHKKCVLIDNPGYWSSGDKMWCIDYFAPFGHYRLMYNLLRNNIFPNNILRGKSRRERSSGIPFLNTFRGANVSHDDYKSWLSINPILERF